MLRALIVNRNLLATDLGKKKEATIWLESALQNHGSLMSWPGPFNKCAPVFSLPSTTHFLPSIATNSGCHMLMMPCVYWPWGPQFTRNSNAPWTGMSYPIILAPCHHPCVELQNCTVWMKLTERVAGHRTVSGTGHVYAHTHTHSLHSD